MYYFIIYHYNVLFQLHGAAHGSGIYLSPRSGTSFGYTNRYYGQTISKVRMINFHDFRI